MSILSEDNTDEQNRRMLPVTASLNADKHFLLRQSAEQYEITTLARCQIMHEFSKSVRKAISDDLEQLALINSLLWFNKSLPSTVWRLARVVISDTAKRNEYSRRESRAMILPRRLRMMVLILWGWTKEPRASSPAESRESFERVL